MANHGATLTLAVLFAKMHAAHLMGELRDDDPAQSIKGMVLVGMQAAAQAIMEADMAGDPMKVEASIDAGLSRISLAYELFESGMSRKDVADALNKAREGEE